MAERDTRIWLVQWLCPERHAAWAVPFTPMLGQTAEQTIALGNQQAAQAGIRQRCGICGKPIAPEATATRYDFEAGEWDAFIQAMQRGMADQIAARAALDAAGATVDSRLN